MKRMDVLAADFKRDRRLANKTFRKFCMHIDLSDGEMCRKKLFSCSKCEVPLNGNDCKQLGLNLASVRGQKRFKSLVMDGKVIGALRDFPVQTSSVQKLVGTKGLTVKLVNNRDTRGALKSFTRVCRQLIRAVEYGRVEQVKGNVSVKDEMVYFRMGALLQLKGITKKNYEEVMDLARWFCNRESCLCHGKKWCDMLGHVECAKRRSEVECKKGYSLAARVVSRVFGVGGSGSGGEVLGKGNVLSAHFNARREREEDCGTAGVEPAGGHGSTGESSDSNDEELGGKHNGVESATGKGTAVDALDQ